MGCALDQYDAVTHLYPENAMTTTSPATAERAASIIADYFRPPILTLESIAQPVAEHIAAELSRGAMSANKLDALIAPFADQLFESIDAPVYGAGFIAAIDLLSDSRSHLAWWQGQERRKLILAAQTVNKERIDYSELEWFRVPLMSGTSHVAGPYVDYLCSDEYTMTIATPVRVDGTFVGVLAFDLLIDSVERQLTPLFRDLSAHVTLVNGVSRVVVSTDAEWATGDVIRSGTIEGHTRISCEGIALDVLVGVVD